MVSKARAARMSKTWETRMSKVRMEKITAMSKKVPKVEVIVTE
ncbi:hypothetical protein [Metabacillus litoralis]|nr:hypothetical protein [Metabacillus litoralis]